MSVKLEKLRPRHCRWPLWQDKAEGLAKDFPHCGTRKLPGKPYCARHAPLAVDTAKNAALGIRLAANPSGRGARLGRGASSAA